MKKTLPLILLLASNMLFAQGPIDKGQAQFNAGLGLSSWGIPIYLGFDYGIHKDVTLGGEASFRSFRNDWKGNRYSHNVIGFAGNANYHFNSILSIPSPWDFYAGLNIGFFLWNSPSGYGGTSSGLGLGAQVGGRYYFTEKVGLNLELGVGNTVSGGKIGVTIKL